MMEKGINLRILRRYTSQAPELLQAFTENGRSPPHILGQIFTIFIKHGRKKAMNRNKVVI